MRLSLLCILTSSKVLRCSFALKGAPRELGVGLLLWATGSSLTSSESGVISLEWRSLSWAFCHFYTILQYQRVQARALKQAGRHKREPLFLEVSSRTSSSPNAGRVELNTDDAWFCVIFGTDVMYSVIHKHLLLRCV